MAQHKHKNPMDLTSKPTRTLLIPRKRALLPIISTSSRSAAKVQKAINPSAVPAKIQLRRPVFSSLETRNEGGKEENEGRCTNHSVVGLEEDRGVPVRVIEFDSSQAPQPFLESEWVLKIMEEKKKKNEDVSGFREVEIIGDDELAESSLTGELSTEMEVRRRAAQADYGSMAIRDRMNVRGRRSRQ